MRLLEALQQLEGKTIKSASIIDCDEVLSIMFTDETCAIFMVTGSSEYPEIYIESDIDNSLKRAAGIISDAEYDLAASREREAFRARNEIQERKKFDELKKKYGE
jgi:hypothetical protein